MAKIPTAVVMLVALVAIAPSDQSKTGLKLRITNKGLKYVWDVAMTSLQADMEGKPLKIKDGRSGKFKYQIRRSLVERFRVGSNHLSSLKGVGVRATVQGISIAVAVDFHFSFKIGFLKISDNVSVRGKTDGANFKIDLGIQKREDGRPLMSLPSCNADVGDLRLHFSHSKMSQIYNMVANMFRGKIRKLLNEQICQSLERQVKKASNEKLAKIKVKKQLDKWAFIDYGLSEAPQFKQDFMDISIKGYFTSVSGKSASGLSPPALPATTESGKMVYCWLSDYLFNTAGEVYHNSGRLQAKIDHNKARGFVKAILSTSPLRVMVPGLYEKYPNQNLSVTIKSSRAPKLLMKPGDVSMSLHAALDFQVLTKGGPVPVFGYNLDVFLKGKIWVTDGYLRGKANHFRIDPMVRFSNVGKINFPISSLRVLFKRLVIDNLKDKFENGMPLPVIGIAELVDPKLDFQAGYMMISSDLKYVPN